MSKEQGCIDGMLGGILKGWVFNQDLPNSERPFFLEVNGEQVGCYTANIYRADLERAGFGSGNHGFEVYTGFDDGSGEQFALRLLDENQAPILNAQWTTPAITSEITLKHARVNRYSISFQVLCKSVLSKKRVTLFANGKVTNHYQLDFIEGNNEFVMNIPAQLINGSEQNLSVNVEGFCGAFWYGKCNFNPSYLPIEQLLKVEQTKGKIGHTASAQARYESLSRAFSRLQSVAAFELINSAHQYLINPSNSTKTLSFLHAVNQQSNVSPTFSVIIYGQSCVSSTLKTIASCVLSNERTDYELIIIDDFSSEDAALFKSTNIKIFSLSDTNITDAVNQCIIEAKSSSHVLIKAGIELSPNACNILVDELNDDQSAAVTSSRIIDERGFLLNAGLVVWNNASFSNIGWQDSPYKPEYSYNRSIDACSTHLFAIKKDSWSSLGQFNNKYEKFDDALIDYCFKAASNNYNLKYCHVVAAYCKQINALQSPMTEQINEQELFQSYWEKELQNQAPPLDDIHLNKDRGISKRVLMIDHSNPIMGQDAGSYAAIQEIKLFLKLGFKVTFLPRNLLDLGEPTAFLQNMGVEVLFAPFYASTQSAINNRIHEMDVIYITRYEVAVHFIPLIKEQVHNLPIIFNNADFHYLRELRQAELNDDDVLKQKALETKNREIAVMEQSDVILSYTQEEGELIKSFVAHPERVFQCPWVVKHQATEKHFEQRSGLAFLGGYRHSPNVDAVKYFANQIMPTLVETNPEIKFYVYGSHMPEELKKLASEYIIIKGHADTLYDVYNNHRVFVCPLNYGAGIKGKLIDSLAFGLPVVASQVAAEGVGLIHNENALICHSSEDWLMNIKMIYLNPEKWSDFRQAGFTLTKAEYSEQNGILAFNNIFKFLKIPTNK